MVGADLTAGFRHTTRDLLPELGCAGRKCKTHDALAMRSHHLREGSFYRSAGEETGPGYGCAELDHVRLVGCLDELHRHLLSGNSARTDLRLGYSGLGNTDFGP